MIKAAVFDFDYTLYDRDASDRIAIGHFYDVHTEYFTDGITKEQAQKAFYHIEHEHNYDGWEIMTKEMASRGIMKTMPSSHEFNSFVQGEIAKYGVGYDYAKPVLNKLHDMDLKVGMITNGYEAFQWGKINGNIDIAGCFDCILIGSDSKTCKPHPDLFIGMADRFHIRTSEMIYVGDNPVVDIEGARNAGCIPVWIRTMAPWRYPDIKRTEYEIDTIKEIPKLIEKINKEQ